MILSMTVAERITALLKDQPDGLDDDQVTTLLKLSRRQHANAVCRTLQRLGIIDRHLVGGKIRNVYVQSSARVSHAHVSGLTDAGLASTKPWCWEGNVVGSVVRHLSESGWGIESVADTASGQRGADIRARRNDEVLLVEVTGYPSKEYERGLRAGQPKRTSPATQARHWVAEALLAAMLHRTAGTACRVALAFPRFDAYTNLLRRIAGAMQALDLEVLVVEESGAVTTFLASKRR